MDRDRSIIAQNAGTTAANLIASAVQAGTLAPASLDDLLDTFDETRTKVFNGILALAGAQAVVETLEGNSSYSEPSSSPAPSGGGSRPHADVEVKIGKYRGKTIGAIYGEPEGADWLDWASKNLSNDWLKGRITEFLQAA